VSSTALRLIISPPILANLENLSTMVKKPSSSSRPLSPVLYQRIPSCSKIGGEMISLGAVEDTVSQVVTDDNIEIAAVTLPDSKKGEKIVVLVSGNADFQKMKQKMKQKKVSPLMIPSDFIKADAIPKLGSGKNDLSQAKKMAMEMI